MNDCLRETYTDSFGKKDIENIFVKGDRFSEVTIDKTLLHHLRYIIKESHAYTFESYTDYDKFMNSMRKKVKYNIILSKTINNIFLCQL